MTNVLIDETNLENIADSIRAKNGSSDTYTPAQMSTAIDNIPSGGDPEEGKEIFFWDYDGTLLHAYTFTEYTTLINENSNWMPSGETHSGLTFLGWNYTNADITTCINTPGIDKIDIGALYRTTDDKFKIYFKDTLETNPYNGDRYGPGIPSIQIGLGIVTGSTAPENWYIKIYWDDGTFDTFDEDHKQVFYHYYDSPTGYPKEAYVSIETNVSNVEDYFGLTFYGGRGYLMAPYKIETNSNISLSLIYIQQNFVETIAVGSELKIDSNILDNFESLKFITDNSSTCKSYKNCYALEHVSVPVRATALQLNSSPFSNCTKLKRIVVPPNTNLPSSFSCSNCINLKELYFPISDPITSLGASYFGGCGAKKIVVPSSVTSLARAAFSGGAEIIDLTNLSAAPTIAANTTFKPTYGHRKIIVPDAQYDTYYQTGYAQSIPSYYLVKASDWNNSQN